MSRDKLIAVGCGGLSAVASLSLIAGSPGALLMVYLAPLPLLLAGLGMGASAAVLAGGAGMVLTVLLGGVMAAALYGLIHALPAWLVVRQALSKLQPAAAGTGGKWYPAGSILSWLTLLGAAVFLLAGVSGLGGGAGIEAAVSSLLDSIFAALVPTLGEADRGILVAAMAPVFPWVTTASWVLMMVLNVILAQGILVRLKKNLRPSPALADLELPDWMSWLLVASAAVALMGTGNIEYIGRNLAMIMAIPFFFLGLAVVHGLSRKVTFPGVLLASFYSILIISQWAKLVVAGVGVIEQWFGLRGRFAKPDNDEESE